MKWFILSSCLLVIGCAAPASMATVDIDPYVSRISEHEEALERLSYKQSKLELRVKQLEARLSSCK